MSRTLLVADDEADLRLAVRMSFRRAGFAVTEAENGLQVLDAAATTRFDAIVLDERMPNLSGLETAARLRDDGYDGPLLIFSGYLDAEARRRAAELDAHTLPKVDVMRIVDLVVELVDGTG